MNPQEQTQSLELTWGQWGLVLAALEEYAHGLKPEQGELAEQVQEVVRRIDER